LAVGDAAKFRSAYNTNKGIDFIIREYFIAAAQEQINIFKIKIAKSVLINGIKAFHG
jgi:hypothetical protein